MQAEFPRHPFRRVRTKRSRSIHRIREGHGINFTHMPELDWTFGYPACVLVIAGICAYVYARFKKSGWL